MSVRGNLRSGKSHSGKCLSGKHLPGELSVRGTLLRENVRWEKVFGELSIGEKSVAEMSVASGHCPRTICLLIYLFICLFIYLFIFEILEIQFMIHYEESETAIQKYWKNSCWNFFFKIQKKTPDQQFHFNKISYLKPAIPLKQRLQHRRFTVIFEIFQDSHF